MATKSMSDFRDRLPDGNSLPWSGKSEFEPAAYQLIDGIDIMVDCDGSAARWNGISWSGMKRHYSNDKPLLDAIAEARSFDTIETGWHVLTGPGIQSIASALENPYRFIRPMLLPARILRISGTVTRRFIADALDRYYIAGLLIEAQPVQAVSFRHGFEGNANLIDMVRMDGNVRLSEKMRAAQSF